MKFYDKAPTTTITLNAGEDVIITENPPTQLPVETDQITALRYPQPNREVQYYDHSRTKHHQKPKLIYDDADWPIDSKTDQPVTQIEWNEPVIDSQKVLNDLFEMLIKIFPHLIDLIKAFKTGNTKALSPLLDIDGIKKILPLVLPLLNQAKPSIEIDDLEQSTKDVWDKITELGNTSFRKVDLTKTLQSKYRAKQIQKALDQLEANGLITHIPESKKGGPGAKRAPLYSVNNKGGEEQV